MDPAKSSGSEEPSREGLPKDEAFKDVAEERAYRTLTKAVPPLRRDPSPLPPQPAIRVIMKVYVMIVRRCCEGKLFCILCFLRNRCMR